MSWLNLDHQVYQEFKELPEIKRVGLAVSGGGDSAALFGVLAQVSSALGWSCQLLHVHHGPDPEPEVESFRSSSVDTVRAWAEQGSMELQIFHHQGEPLKSEADFRKVRRSALFKFKEALDLDAILTAHHQQDLLETRLIQLVRGCGLEGLSSLKFRSEIFLRPFVQRSRTELTEYVDQRQLSYKEDPTNSDPGHGLRNWMRNSWLPDLESSRPGAVSKLAQSLEQVVVETELMRRDNPAFGILAPGEWDRRLWESLNPSERLQALVWGLQDLPGVEFSRAQLLEVLKRLDNPQKEYKFSTRGLVWEVSPFKVKVTREIGK